jgi:hypothetical protein
VRRIILHSAFCFLPFLHRVTPGAVAGDHEIPAQGPTVQLLNRAWKVEKTPAGPVCKGIFWHIFSRIQAEWSPPNSPKSAKIRGEVENPQLLRFTHCLVSGFNSGRNPLDSLNFGAFWRIWRIEF